MSFLWLMMKFCSQYLLNICWLEVEIQTPSKLKGACFCHTSDLKITVWASCPLPKYQVILRATSTIYYSNHHFHPWIFLVLRLIGLSLRPLTFKLPIHIAVFSKMLRYLLMINKNSLLWTSLTNLRFQWEEEIRVQLPNSVHTHQVFVMNSGKDIVDGAKVLILSYDLLVKKKELIKEMRFGVIIMVWF